MPWNNQSGGSGGNGQGPRGPWSRGPSGGGAPDLEDLFRRWQEGLKQLIPQGGLPRGTLPVAGLVVLGLWLFFGGIYFVASHEQGFVMRFGRVVAHSSRGINYHLPWPIETAQVVQGMGGNQLVIGTQPGSDTNDTTQSRIDFPAESLMLTADQNIVDINFSVLWTVKDASAYHFSVDAPDNALKAVAESTMREVIGQSTFDAINPNREAIASRVRRLMQTKLDLYGAGVEITSVQLGKVSAPEQVGKADRDVQAAQTSQEGMRSDAEAYANRVIPEARGQAAQIVQQAEAYRQQAIAEASGEAKRFLAIYQEYRKAPEVTRKRMYLETMSKVLAPMNKVIVDGPTAQIVIANPPLADTPKNRGETVTVTAPPASTGTAVQTPGQPQITAGPQQ
jgi:modulator of FtsH protease HflK